MLRVKFLFVSVLFVFATAVVRAQTPLDPAFTYQGELASADTPVTGIYDLRFRLYDAASGGNQIGSTLCSDSLTITAGRFSVLMDFGSAFAGQKRFLEIEVRADTGLDCSDATGYTVLTPRQEITATPNAAFALNADTAASALTASNATSFNGQSAGFYQDAANLTGTVADARLSNNVARLDGNQTFTGLINFSNAANIFSGTFHGSGAGLTSLNGANIIPGTVSRSALNTDLQNGLGSHVSSWGVTPYRNIGTAATGTNPNSVAVSGSYAYVVNYGSNTLQVFNISNPAAPTAAGSVETGTQPYWVAVSGSFAYVVGNSNTLQVFNISNPAAPTLAGSVATGNTPWSVAVSGSFAYVVNLSSNTLQVFDISNPATPTLAGSVAAGNNPLSVAVSGSYAYVANYGSNTLQVFDINNPAAPTLAGSVATGIQPYCVAVSGSFAYVVNFISNTLQVFNVSNPAAPTLAGTVAAGSGPYSVAVSGSFAYVVNINSNTLQVFNISNPAAITLAGNIATESRPASVSVSGSYAYIVNNTSGTLQVFAGGSSVEFFAPIAASSLSGADGSGLINLNASNITTGTISQSLLPASPWSNVQLGNNSIISSGSYAPIGGTAANIAMRQGVAVVNWSTTAFTNAASTSFLLRVRAVTNGVQSTGPASRFFFNQTSVHQSISGNAVLPIPSTGTTTFYLEVIQTGGLGAYQTDLNDSFTASIINIGQ
jgi:hypothetical protein